MPQISSVAPKRNREAFQSSLMRNLQQQSVEDWECPLVDGGSEDRGTERLARCCAGDPRLRLRLAPPPALPLGELWL